MITFLKKHRVFFSFSGLLLLLFLLHSTYLLNNFVWLDHGDIEEGRTIISLIHLPDMFYMRFGETGFYRPLVTFFNSLDFTLYQGFAPGYHLTNVFLHLVIAAVVPLFLSVFLTLSLPEMLIAAFLFSIHPLTWLPVGAISYRPELLYTLFSMLTIYFHHKSRESGRQRFAFFTVIAFFAALLSKETTLVIIPAIIVLYEVWQRRNNVHKKHILAWSLLFSEAVVFGIYLLFRFRAVPEVWKSSGIYLPFSQAIGTRVEVLIVMLGHFINPLHIPLSDAVRVTGIVSLSSIILIVLGILLFLIIKKAGLYSKLTLLIFIFLISLAPVLNIVSLPRFGSPHYGYFPLAIFCAFVILFLRWAQKKSIILFRSCVFIGIVWIAAMVWTTFQGGWQFQNDKTLFTPEVAADPHFLEGYFYLGNWYLRARNLALAEKNYQAAMQVDPKYIAYSEQRSIRINLSSVYIERNQLDKADQMLSEAEYLPSSDNVTELIHNRMILDYKRHKYKDVYELSQDGRAFPYSPIIYEVLADSLHHLGQDKEAAKVQRALNEHLTKDQKIQLEYTLKLLQK